MASAAAVGSADNPRTPETMREWLASGKRSSKSRPPPPSRPATPAPPDPVEQRRGDEVGTVFGCAPARGGHLEDPVPSAGSGTRRVRRGSGAPPRGSWRVGNARRRCRSRRDGPGRPPRPRWWTRGRVRAPARRLPRRRNERGPRCGWPHCARWCEGTEQERTQRRGALGFAGRRVETQLVEARAEERDGGVGDRRAGVLAEHAVRRARGPRPARSRCGLRPRRRSWRQGRRSRAGSTACAWTADQVSATRVARSRGAAGRTRRRVGPARRSGRPPGRRRGPRR